MGLIVEVGMNVNRRAPVEFADAVEEHFRKTGRHGRLYWVNNPPMWVIKVTLRPDDGRLRAWQEGRLSEEPFEQVELVEWKPDAVTLPDGRVLPGYVGLPIEELGVSGLINFLEKGDVLSGQGEFESLSAAVAYQWKNQREEYNRARLEQRDSAVRRAKDRRRTLLKIPFLGVGIDLQKPATTPAGGE